MRSLDRLFEHSSRSLARHTSRRSLLATLGKLLTGAALVPLLPVDRSSRAAAAEAPATANSPASANTRAPANVSHARAQADAGASKNAHTDDPMSCEYWKYCAIDGFLCSCCGGSANSCPPGTAPSPITWIGTCHNPADGRDYIVSYNDCCGKTSCGNCECNRNEREKPMYRPSRNNDLNWCMANADSNYHCSVSVILGVAEK
jgi:methylamine dehydrogenase light chain